MDKSTIIKGVLLMVLWAAGIRTAYACFIVYPDNLALSLSAGVFSLSIAAFFSYVILKRTR